MKRKDDDPLRIERKTLGITAAAMAAASILAFLLARHVDVSQPFAQSKTDNSKTLILEGQEIADGLDAVTVIPDRTERPKPLFNQELDGAISFLENSNNKLLTSLARIFERCRNSGQLVPFPVMPIGAEPQRLLSDDVDLYFKDEEGRLVTYLVFDPIKTREEKISPARLGVAIAQKVFVWEGLLLAFNSSDRSITTEQIISRTRELRDTLETTSRRSIIRYALVPMAKNQSLDDPQLIALAAEGE